MLAAPLRIPCLAILAALVVAGPRDSEPPAAEDPRWEARPYWPRPPRNSMPRSIASAMARYPAAFGCR